MLGFIADFICDCGLNISVISCFVLALIFSEVYFRRKGTNIPLRPRIQLAGIFAMIPLLIVMLADLADSSEIRVSDKTIVSLSRSNKSISIKGNGIETTIECDSLQKNSKIQDCRLAMGFFAALETNRNNGKKYEKR